MNGIIANWFGVVALMALALALAVFAALPGAALAQEIIGLDTRQRVDVPAGPYSVVVEAKPLPSLQAAQFFITVADAASGAPAGEVKVRVLASLQGAEEHGYALATKVDTPGVFTATLSIETPGVWETDLEIESPAGDTYLTEGFDFEVIAPRGSWQAGGVFVGVAVVLLAGGAYVVWQIRRAQRRRAIRRGTAVG